jgi:N-methylhydantoinase B
LNPGTPSAWRLGKITLARLAAGDTFSVTTSGGGGFFDSLDSDPARVLEDVRNGVLTVGAAEPDYGAVVTDTGVDQPATCTLRETMGRGPQCGLHDLGAARTAYEAVFQHTLCDTIAELLRTLPPDLRYYAESKVFDGVRAEAPRDRAPTAQRLRAAWPELCASIGWA